MVPLPPIKSFPFSEYRAQLPKVLREPQAEVQDSLPEPAFFESLDEFFSYADCRNSDPDRAKLISVIETENKKSIFNRKRDRPELLVCHDFQGGYNEKDDERS